MRIGKISHNGSIMWLCELDGKYYISKVKHRYPWGFGEDDFGSEVPKPGFLLPPVSRPCAIRDFFSFEGHVLNSRRRRGLQVPDEWYRYPVFYFTNPNNLIGSGYDVKKPKNTKKMDFEAEFFIIIGKKGIDIPRSSAMDYIAGLSLANDWSARDIQFEEVKVGLGPAKGKDFATSLGPLLITGEDLHDIIDGDEIHADLSVFVNGKKLSEGNLDRIYWTYADMIKRASEDCFLYPGDIIMSGTIENGCISEIGEENCSWLEPGDTVTLHSNILGDLTNRVI